MRRGEVGGKKGELLIHRSAVPLLQQEKAKVRSGGCIVDGRSMGESALLIHRGAVPLSRYGSGTLGLFHSPGVKFSPLVPLRYRQEKARTGGGTNMPSPVGEGGSRRLTDEAFFSSVEILL